MNMRKIVAMLAAVLMLCAAIPVAAFSIDFEDGTANGWQSDCGVAVENIDGSNVLVWNATLDWANMYNYCNLSANTEYVMTMKVKADRDTDMNFKVLKGDWSATTYVTTFGVTTEWQEISVQFNSGDGSFVMLSSNTEAAYGATYYVDDFSIEEYVAPVVPGTVINGDFETGDATGWNLPQVGSVKAEAAHDGSYGINVKGSGSYGGLLDQTISVEAGKSYDISFWLKVNANGINYQIKDGDTSGANIAGEWVDMNKAGEWKYFTATVTPTTDLLTINFCGAGNEIAEDAYIDSVTCTEHIDAVWSANFNDGEKKFNNGEIAVGPDGSNCFKWSANGAWSATYVVIPGMDPSKDYTITMKAKASVAGNMGVTIQNGDWGTYWNAPAFAVTTEWQDIVYTIPANSVPFAAGSILFKFQDVGLAMDLYVDDIVIVEGLPEEEPSSNLLVNGDFETGEIAPWDNLWGSNRVEMVAGYNSDYAMKVTANGAWGHVRQTGIAVKPNTDYTITMYAKDASGYTLLVKDGGDSGNIAQTGLNAGAEWTPIAFTFNTGDNSSILFSFMSNNAGDTCTVDDVVLFEGVPEKPVKELTNGDFEAGELGDWINLWGSNTVTFVEGYEGNYAMSMVVPADKQWSQVRQDDITVKPNTDYRLTAYVKGAQNMAFVIKKGGDAGDMTSHNDCIFPAGEDWQKVSLVFNTADQTAICILIINYEKGGSVIIDNITLEEIVPCEHNYEITNGEFATCETDGWAEYTCSLCGDSYTETITAYHNGGLEYSAAVEAIDCANPGHVEYWFCPGCYEYFADAEASEYINPWYITITVDCVRPEGIADCATVDCEICGNEIYGYGEHDVLACQGGTCSKCGDEIEGYGCANYATPACEDGVCYYCGGFVAGFGHENGAWAPCCDGECAYGCGLTYPAAEDHVDEDANDYCDNCWSHLACADADGDGWCDVCWREMPAEPEVEIIYGDANGDGEINILDEALLSQYNAGWDVTLNETAADANGDGEINILDEALLSQYNAGWDVTLGG